MSSRKQMSSILCQFKTASCRTQSFIASPLFSLLPLFQIPYSSSSSRYLQYSSFFCYCLQLVGSSNTSCLLSLLYSLLSSSPLYIGQIGIRRRQLSPSSSSSDSDGSDIRSCFDNVNEQEETDVTTEPTDGDTDVDLIDICTNSEGCNEVDLTDLAQIFREDNAYLPEYYLDQENDSNESEDEDKDYSDNSILFLDMIEV